MIRYASFERILKLIGQYKSERYAEYVPRICSPKNISIQSNVSTMDETLMEEYILISG